MEFSIATLLSHFTDDKLVAGKVLEKKLGCQDSETIEKVQIALDVLEKIGVLIKDRGKYRRIYKEDVVEAKLRCSSKGFCFAIQDAEEADDIYVRESHLSSAWNGDLVLVKIIKEGSRRRSPEGEVKLILERANPSLLATVKQNNGGYRAVPLDDRLLFELDLQNNEEPLEEAIDHLVHVAVKRYPLGNNLPIGRVTRVLGSDAEAAADTDIVCCKHDLPQAFSDEVIEAAKSLPSKLRTTEIKKRLDLRKLLTITIEDTTELENNLSFVENAFTLEKTKSDDWQLGIHSTDLAYYIEADSPLDLCAKKRGTSIYLGDKLIPLFPKDLISRYSLISGEDRLTLSVLITLNEKGEVIEFEIRPSVIKVDHQLSYQQAQSFLGNQEEIEKEWTEVVEMLNELFFTLSPLVKAHRLQRGGFEIALEEAQSPYKDEGRLGVLVVASSLPIRSLLTELVILAGKVVAEHLIALGVPGIYCNQPESDFEELEDLLKLGNNLALDLDIESDEKITSGDYQKLTQKFANSPEVKVLNYLLQGTLKPAKYSNQPELHFGLAYQDGYTHCVSPGQRYADLLIQRLLHTIFELGRDRRHSRAKNIIDLSSSSCHGQINWNVLPPQTQTNLEADLAATITHLNEREKLAQDAEKDLQGLKKAEKMKERTGKVFQGLITGVQSYGFFVEIEDLLVEGLVHVSSLKDDWYEYRSRHSCLIGRKNRIAYRLGDRVEVEVKSVDYYRQQIDLVTVRGGSNIRDEDLEDD